MKRLAVALAAGAAVSTLAFASASVLSVDGGTVQAGGDTTLSCDADGVKANWGLETDDNSVRSVRIDGIDASCVGSDLFVSINGAAAKRVTIDAPSESIAFTAPFPTPESINDLRIWIEG
jgi:hypothetical protein